MDRGAEDASIVARNRRSREASTSPAQCRSVSSSSDNGSSHGAQPSSTWVKATGRSRVVSLIVIVPLKSCLRASLQSRRAP
jgi:hypothetical protein